MPRTTTPPPDRQRGSSKLIKKDLPSFIILLLLPLLLLTKAPENSIVVTASSGGGSSGGGGGGAFLESKVPLKVVSIIPSNNDDRSDVPGGTRNDAKKGGGVGASSSSSSSPYRIRGRDALTVVFSRPIIALGGDYDYYVPYGEEEEGGEEADNEKRGSSLPSDKVPFHLYQTVTDSTKFYPLQVPGKLRYVTTFLSRFDVDVDWPPDLDILLDVNTKNLVSHDGVKVVKTEGGQQQQKTSATYRTDSLSMHLTSVTSQRAYELSDGRWTSGGSKFEVPPDGILTLTFTYDVDLSVLGQGGGLVIRPTSDFFVDDDEATIAIHPCGIVPPTTNNLDDDDDGKEKNENSVLTDVTKMGRCIQVTPRNLITEREYTLIMPKGTRYHPMAGPLRTDLKVTFTGLKKFVFRWEQKWRLDNVRYNRWDMALSHGLKDGVTAQDFKNVITINKGTVPYDVILVDNGTLRLQFDSDSCEGNKEYAIAVSGKDTKIKDGFDLPLQSSDAITVKTSSIRDATFDITSHMVLTQPPKHNQWTFLLRGKDVGYSITEITSNTVSDILSTDPFGWRGKSKFIGTLQSHEELRRYDVPIPKSNFFLRRTSHRNAAFYTTITDLYVATVRDTAGVTSWVLRYSDGTIVKGATCSYYGEKGEVIERTTTDESGMCHNGNEKSSQSRYLYVTHNEEVAFTELSYQPQTTPKYQSILITDRGVYKPGDTIYYKGYIRSMLHSPTWDIPQFESTSVSMEIIVDGKTQMTYEDVEVMDKKFGSFHGKIDIPTNAQHGTVQLLFGKKHPATASVVISNPRRPTGTLELIMENKVYIPETELELGVKVQTGTGSPVVGAEVMIRWTHTHPVLAPMRGGGKYGWWSPPSSEPIVHTGAVTVTTEASGEGTLNLDMTKELTQLLLSSNNNKKQDDDGNDDDDDVAAAMIQIGDYISFEAQWIGPTGELLTQTTSDIPVANSEWTVRIETTVTDPIPGFEFGVRIGVYDADGLSVNDVNAMVTLESYVEEEDDEEENMDVDDVKVAAKCTGNADDMYSIQCHDKMKLPTPDKYTLRVRVQDTNDVTVETTVTLGKTPEEWERNPLKNFDISLKVDKNEYRVGDDIVLSFFNPFKDARLLLTWGNVNGYQHQVIGPMENGDVTHKVSTTNILGGCIINAYLFVPHQKGIQLPVQIPISKSWDLGMPRSMHFSQTLTMIEEDRALDVAVVTSSTSKDGSQPPPPGPGDSVDLTISITDPKTKKPVVSSSSSDVEIAIVVVDNAYLQLTDHPLPSLNETFHMDVPTPLSSRDTVEYLVPTSGYEEAIETAFRRWKLDPWIYPSEGVCCDSDFDDETYMGMRSTWITEAGSGMLTDTNFGGGGAKVGASVRSFDMDDAMEEESLEMAPMMMAKSGPPPQAMAEMAVMAGDEGGGGGSSDTTTATTTASSLFPPLRSNFEITPLFTGQLLLLPDNAQTGTGTVTTTLTLPDTLTTYSIRVYAVDTSHRFGSIETDLVVKKKVNIQPMVPRMVRITDKFWAGVTIEFDERCLNEKNEVTVSVTAQSLPTVVKVETATIDSLLLNGVGPHKIKFDMTAVSIGDGMVNLFANTKNCGEDVIAVTIPVLPLQDPVTVATSMAIRGGTTTDDVDEEFVWEEGIAFPRASPGSGTLTLSAGVGRFPAIKGFVDSLLVDPEKYQYAGDYLMAIGLEAAMEPYAFTTNTAAGNGKKHDKPKELTSTMNTLFFGLNTLTTDLGLEWRDRTDCRGSNSPYYCNVRYVDATLNANALILTKRLAKLSLGSYEIRKSVTTKWRDVLIQELTHRANDARAHDRTFHDWDLLARAYVALGPGFSTDRDLAFANLAGNRKSVPLTGRLLLALYLVEHPEEKIGGEKASDIVREIMDGTYNNIRVQGRTAYVGYGHGRRNALSMEAQGLALSLFASDLDTYGSDLLVEKIANWVSRGNAVGSNVGGGSYMSLGYTDVVFGALGLADYDTAHSSTDPNLHLLVDSGDVNVLTAEFTSSSSFGTVSATKSWSELLPAGGISSLVEDAPVVTVNKPENLVFHGTGIGEASVAVELTFVPDRLSTNPVYRGIFVDKIVRLIDPQSGQPNGEPIQIVQSGCTVEVTLQMTTPDDLRFVTLVDFVPGGLEPIDTNLLSSSQNQHLGGGTYYGGGGGGGGGRSHKWWYHNPFDTPQTYPDRVQWTSSWISAGTHSATYRAVAVTEGVFALSPTKAYAIDQPELMGLSWSGSLLVTDEIVPRTKKEIDMFLEERDVTRNARLTEAKECKRDCDMGEECNIVTGKCEVSKVDTSLFTGGSLDGDGEDTVDTSRSAALFFSVVAWAIVLSLMVLPMTYVAWTNRNKKTDVEPEEEDSLIDEIEMKRVV